MNWKKILSGLLIGAFAFGVTAGNVSAESKNKDGSKVQVSDDVKHQPPQVQDGDHKNPPEPPKDENGKQLPPPDKKDKKLSDGKHLQHPDKKDISQKSDSEKDHFQQKIVDKVQRKK